MLKYRDERRDVRKAIRVAIYLLLTAFLVGFFSHAYGVDATENDSSDIASEADVLFVGTSGFGKAIIPMELFDDGGIASYNLTSSWAQIPLNYYMIKEYTSEQTKLIVLDMETFLDEDVQGIETIHYTTDQMPLNSNKLELATSDAYGLSLSERAEILLPTFRYHDRWNDTGIERYLSEAKTRCEIYNCYGYIFEDNIYADKGLNYSIGLDYEKNRSLEYLLKIKDYCQKNNIELLLMTPPWYRYNEEQCAVIEKVAKEHGLKYVDFRNDKELKLEKATDFSDHGHLNTKGAIKNTRRLGEYLKENYSLEGHRGEVQYGQWEKDLEVYNSLRTGVLDGIDEKRKN